MITTFLLVTIFGTINTILAILPDATVSQLPVIGNILSSTLTTMVSYWYGFMDTFPYFTTLWDVVIYVILPFEIMLLLGKFLLGNRMPNH